MRRDPPRPEVIPQRGASISAAGSSAPLERDRACRDLSLGLCPSSALLAKRFAARLLEYPPSGVRLIRPASVTCGHLHRDPMDLIRFSRFAGLSPPPLRIESNPSGAFALRCQALLHNSVSGQTGWAREATPCHLPGPGATPWLYSPTGEWLPPSFTAHDGRTASRPARAHVISATPASHFRYTWFPSSRQAALLRVPRLLPCGATRLDSRFFPTGASIAAAGSSAPLERDCARRGLDLGLCPSEAFLAKRRAACRPGYPPGSIRSIHSASEGCKPLFTEV